MANSIYTINSPFKEIALLIQESPLAFSGPWLYSACYAILPIMKGLAVHKSPEGRITL